MLTKLEEAIHTIVQAEEQALEDFTVEGYRTNQTKLFKCRYCRREAWGVLALNTGVQHAPTCPLGSGAVPGDAEYESWFAR